MDPVVSVFMADHRGKCVECEDSKPLDEMVRQRGQKGLYYCLDCLVEANYAPAAVVRQLQKEKYEMDSIIEDRQGWKVARLLCWLFG